MRGLEADPPRALDEAVWTPLISPDEAITTAFEWKVFPPVRAPPHLNGKFSRCSRARFEQ